MNCKANGPLAMPKRILRVKSSHDPQAPFRIRLMNTKNTKMERYVALSHCWGLERSLATESTTVDSWMRDIPWSRLPKTFQHAIEITALLGFSYIWIDSLCILQDSRPDWEEQSAHMAAIYEHAVVTLAAGSATGDTEGFLRPRPKLLNGTVMFQPENPNLSPKPVAFRQALTHHFLPSIDPLEKRAWAFQERLLSTRVLLFSLHELRWECNTVEQCECRSSWDVSHTLFNDPHPYSRKHLSQETPRHKLHKFWYCDIIPRFTNASLTKESDKLPALSGVVQVLSKLLKDPYVAGIWNDGSMRGFLWNTAKRENCFVSRTYRAPSFSWASLDYMVSYNHLRSSFEEREDITWLTEVVEIRCSLAGLDPFGQVTDGYAIFDGPLVSAWLHFPPDINGLNVTFQPASSTAANEYISFQPDVTLAVSRLSPSFPWPLTVHRAEQDPGRIEGSYCCYLMRLCTKGGGDYCLVLGASLRKPGAFERLGFLARLSRLGIENDIIHKGFKGATKTRLTIV
ncbi:HET-domain-containing protein [Mytilinidion resinicola]|uniref:HET-domain-containing protein n=1 Tax=Mytilinidion resinicola TaxID=574789 RepID=A0A6A6YAE5_9PEZI|nr:HET-domain-containing protein [Mytilinidion resinicola]KAF2805538.1 HET-domain-containing protein [Mytilinidion resinicola]